MTGMTQSGDLLGIFAGGPDGERHICLFDLAKQEPIQLLEQVPAPQHHDNWSFMMVSHDHIWSPDGKQLAVTWAQEGILTVAWLRRGTAKERKACPLILAGSFCQLAMIMGSWVLAKPRHSIWLYAHCSGVAAAAHA